MKVVWEIDVTEESSSVKAALEAYIAMRVRSTTATVYTVLTKRGRKKEVDVSKHLAKPFGAAVSSLRRSENEEYFLIAVIDGAETRAQIYGPFKDRAQYDRKINDLELVCPTGLKFLTLVIDPFEVKLDPVNR